MAVALWDLFKVAALFEKIATMNKKSPSIRFDGLFLFNLRVCLKQNFGFRPN